MARGGKSGQKARGRPKKLGPNSDDKNKGVKLLDEIMGVSELMVEEDSDEDRVEQDADLNEIRTPGKGIATVTNWIEEVERESEDRMTKFVPPIMRSIQMSGPAKMEEGESSMVTITEEEIEFWLPSIVGYVVGANPPLHVLDGFVRRLWKTDVSKVGMIGHGLFIIRF